MKFLLPLFILGFGAYSQAQMCQSPDFNPLFVKLKDTTRISEAIQLRRDFLPRLCDLKDFARLTDLEVLEDGTQYFERYKRELGNFLVDNVDPYLTDRAFFALENTLRTRLVPKLDPPQEVALRYKLLPTVRSCGEFESLTSAWMRFPSYYLCWELQRMYETYDSMYCRYSRSKRHDRRREQSRPGC
jgi:hypothetical protein